MSEKILPKISKQPENNAFILTSTAPKNKFSTKDYFRK